MKTVGERIKAYRKQLGLSQKEFAEKCGAIDNRERSKWGQSRIGNYEINARQPDLGDIKVIAQVIGIEAGQLAFQDEFEIIGKPRDGLLKVIGEAIMSRDGCFYMEERLLGYINMYSSDPLAYVLKVKGNSMEPRIFSGEFVVIEPSTPFYAGDEVFVRTIEGTNMIKTFDYNRDGETRLSSVNRDHESFTLDNNQIHTINAVVAIVKRSRFVSLEEVNFE